MRNTPRPLRQTAFTLVELLVVIAVIGILLGLLLPAVQSARETARRNGCTNHLRQLGIALQSFHNKSQHFPPGALLHDLPGEASIGWRVAILPYLEESTLVSQIAPQPHGGVTSWNAQTNSIEIFVCPSAPPQANNSLAIKSSHYSGVGGPGRDNRRIALGAESQCGDVSIDGLLYPESFTRIAQIEDGTSHTLALGERTYIFSSGWMMGADWDGSTRQLKTSICAHATNNIRFPINADLEAHGYYRYDFNAPPPQRTAPLNDLSFGSFHSGGANFCFADSSVRLISEEIDFTLFEDLSTIAGDEVIREQF